MISICIKTFTSGGSTFIKNLNYLLIEYDNQNMFYVGVIPDKGPCALYSISNKYRSNFLTTIEQRKEKLNKIYESRR